LGHTAEGIRDVQKDRTTSRRPGPGEPYDEITDKIIAELETGRVPWVQL
jgi:antirestriction protein ArdC